MMEFPQTTKEEDDIAEAEGFRIFGELRKRYSNDNMRDMDIVLNSLCCALIRLGHLSTRKEDKIGYLSLINQIINQNLWTDQ